MQLVPKRQPITGSWPGQPDQVLTPPPFSVPAVPYKSRTRSPLKKGTSDDPAVAFGKNAIFRVRPVLFLPTGDGRNPARRFLGTPKGRFRTALVGKNGKKNGGVRTFRSGFMKKPPSKVIAAHRLDVMYVSSP